MPHFHRPVYAALAAVLLAIGPRPAFAQDLPDPQVDIGELKKSGKPPKAIKRNMPEYPREMSRAGLIGAVKISFIIDHDGNVRNPYVLESNNPWFERPAVDAILTWKFEPAEINGRHVNTRAMQLMEFRMNWGGHEPELWQVTKGKEHAKLPPELQWDTPPTPTNTMFPVYPFAQLQAGVTGKARISYVVGPNGRVVRAELVETTTPEFGLAVLAMIDAWRFKPARKKDGTPAYANIGSEYEFRPSGRGDVPVSEEARDILRDLARKPGSISTGIDLDQPLHPLSRRPPAYPTAFTKTGQDGEAVIEFYVDRNGDAQLPRIVSSTAPEFGYAAVQAVATWRFEPPKRNGKSTVVLAQIPVTFSLLDKKPVENRKN